MSIEDTLKYMDSKNYKKIIANAQKEFKDLTNRDIEFFNSGKECFREYVLRLIEEKRKERADTRVPKDYYGRMPTAFNTGYFQALRELKEELGK